MEIVNMNKFKLYLFLFILPLSFLLYHVTSFEVGINALLIKKKQLNNLYEEKTKLENKINRISHRIKLLNSDDPDLDLLEEKSFEILGNAEKNTFHVLLKNL